jgi:hypothetical protein
MNVLEAPLLNQTSLNPIYHTKDISFIIKSSLPPIQKNQKKRKSKESSSKLSLTRLNTSIALRLRHNNALLHTLLLPQVLLNSSLRRNSIGLILAQRVLRVRVLALGISTRVVGFVALDDALVDFVTGLVDETRASLVARGEGDFAFHCFDLLFVEQVAVLIAELDFLFGGGAGGYDWLFLRSDVDVFLGVFGDRGSRADVCLGSSGRAGGGHVVDSVFSVLEVNVLAICCLED